MNINLEKKRNDYSQISAKLGSKGSLDFSTYYKLVNFQHKSIQNIYLLILIINHTKLITSIHYINNINIYSFVYMYKVLKHIKNIKMRWKQHQESDPTSSSTPYRRQHHQNMIKIYQKN